MRSISNRHWFGTFTLRSFTGLLSLALFCCLSAGSVAAQETVEKNLEPHSGHSGHMSGDKPSPEIKPVGKLVIPDVEVTSQDGKKLNFFSDLIKGKKVLISFIYTSCQVTCPMAGRNFEKLQERIGKDLGKDVFLISVSTDPVVDTPSVLKTWSERFNRRDGWTLVTGDKTEMEKLLMTLTGNGPQRGLHSSLLVMFDEKTGAWDTSSSLLEPARLLDKLSALEKPPAR